MKLPPVLGMSGGDYINASFIDVSDCLVKVDITNSALKQ